MDGETIDSLRDEMKDEDTDGAGRTPVLRDVEGYLEDLDRAADEQIRDEKDPTDVARELLEQVRSHGGEIKAGEEAIWPGSGTLVEEILEVRIYDGTHCVEDTSGQVWRPDEEAEAEINASDDPEATALRICGEEPARGEWRS